MTIYFAYGSNLCRASMLRRCPKAEPVCSLKLKDSRLVFRGVADCIYEEGAVCHGGLWRITPACERSLDVYEGVSGGMYRKEYVDYDGIAGETRFMLYVMNSTGIMPPSAGYLGVIRQGYRDFKLPMAALDDAVRGSWDDKHPSHVERKRHRRNGRPTLARRPADPHEKAEPHNCATRHNFGT